MNETFVFCWWSITVTAMNRVLTLVLALMSFLVQGAQPAALTWDKQKDLVTADVKDWSLGKLLEKLAEATDWEVYVQPNTELEVSAKFKNNPSGEALSKLLGKLSYAVLPATNGTSRLLVFRTQMQDATQLVKAAKKKKSPNAIETELVVTLKPGENIDELAKKYGAKVVGRIDELNTYRLKFESAADAAKARELMAGDSAVDSIDLNYAIDRPNVTDTFPLNAAPNISLRPSAGPGNDGKTVVALIDTVVQKTGVQSEAFLLDQVSVAGESSKDLAPTHGTSMFHTFMQGLQTGLGENKDSTVRVLPVDVYGTAETTTTFHVAQGINVAMGYDPKVMVLALGSDGESSYLRNMLSRAQAQDITIVAAAGNAPLTTPNYPAGWPEALGVTAIDRRGNLASWANRSPENDLAAPSSFVYRYGPQNFFVSGTSASTAFVGGQAASLRQTGNTGAQAQSALRQAFPVPAPK